jgi:hypothetical protein
VSVAFGEERGVAVTMNRVLGFLAFAVGLVLAVAGPFVGLFLGYFSLLGGIRADPERRLRHLETAATATGVCLGAALCLLGITLLLLGRVYGQLGEVEQRLAVLESRSSDRAAPV